MTALSQIARDHALDALNTTEMESEFVLIPWDRLRAETSVEADLMRSRMAANQCAYFQRRDR